MCNAFVARADLEAEIEGLHTTMMAAAVEIQEQWEHHCDEEGYGPANLMHRLERGINGQYGYDAKTIVRMDKRVEDLEAEVFRLREHIIDQTKLEQEIAQLRKERQAFKDVTEYQASENAKLREALEEISDHAPWGGSKDKYIVWLRETARATLEKLND